MSIYDPFESLKDSSLSQEEIDSCTEVISSPIKGRKHFNYGSSRPDVSLRLKKHNPIDEYKNAEAAAYARSHIKQITEETRKILSEVATKRWQDSDRKEKMAKKLSSLKWCNDGVKSYRLPEDEIPEGYNLGRIKWTRKS
jgi:hypothetical protein